MKRAYIQDLKLAFKSPEYWFAFILIIVTAAWTAVYNMDKYGVLYRTDIGAAEFFYASIMRGNTLLQISATIIPIFVSMHASGLYSKPLRNSASENVKKQTAFSRALSTISISSSIFFFSYLLISIIGIIFFSNSTGAINELGGPFNDIYYAHPFSIIPLTILYTCAFASIYSLLGMGIGMNLKKYKLLALFLPLTYYFCFTYIVELLPTTLQNIFIWILPLDTFNLVGSNVPLYKRLSEMIFVLIIAIALIIIAKRRDKDSAKNIEPTIKESP